VLTRLEVSGFKNLIDFEADFGPFTCIAGENGVGKSNVFDAVQFLSLTADRTLPEAAQEVRSTREESAGEPEHLFTSGVGPSREMRFTAEMIVPREVVDDFGTSVPTSITFLRYELALAYEQAVLPRRQGRLFVTSERLRHINLGEASRHLRFPHAAAAFRKSAIVGRRSGGPFISTEPANSRITVHQDGGSRGRPKRVLPTQSPRTVVSTVNSAEDPTVLAVRRELQGWRRLALEPTAMRAADGFNDPSMMGSDGKHLAAALYRIANSQPDGARVTPEDVYARITSRLGGLAGLDVKDLHVDADETRQLLHIVVTDLQGREFPARSLSEGTLRYLALCVLLEDPSTTGLVTMEEPENGIHPANLPEIVNLIRDLAVDPTEPIGADNPLRQVIVNTHSPAVVQLVGVDDLLMARESVVRVGSGTVRALRVEGMQGTWRVGSDDRGASKADLLPYLSAPPGRQISLFDDIAS